MRDCERRLANSQSALDSDAVDCAQETFERIAIICAKAGITGGDVRDNDAAALPPRDLGGEHNSASSVSWEDGCSDSLDVEYSDDIEVYGSLHDECRSEHSAASTARGYEGSVSALSSRSTRRLQDEIASAKSSHSDDAWSAMQLKLAQTNERINKLEAATHDTKRAVERSMQDQAQYWRVICDELVRGKRGLETQLAEERGRLAALKRYTDSHSNSPRQKKSSPTLSLSDISSESEAIAPNERQSHSPVRDNNSSPTIRSAVDEKTKANGGPKAQTSCDDRLPSFRRNYLSLGQSRQHSPSR